jgi:hypothetical protein
MASMASMPAGTLASLLHGCEKQKKKRSKEKPYIYIYTTYKSTNIFFSKATHEKYTNRLPP